MALVPAERALVGLGLRYSLSCGRDSEADARTEPQAIPRFSVAHGAVVYEQCPMAGTRLKPGATVALSARATLPGGYSYNLIGAPSECAN